MYEPQADDPSGSDTGAESDSSEDTSPRLQNLNWYIGVLAEHDECRRFLLLIGVHAVTV